MKWLIFGFSILLLSHHPAFAKKILSELPRIEPVQSEIGFQTQSDGKTPRFSLSGGAAKRMYDALIANGAKPTAFSDGKAIQVQGSALTCIFRQDYTCVVMLSPKMAKSSSDCVSPSKENINNGMPDVKDVDQIRRHLENFGASQR